MSYIDFLYRQWQRFRYHTTPNATLKRIAEINQYHKRIDVKENGFFIKELNFVVPKSGFEFVFQAPSFDLLVSNAKRLNGAYRIQNKRLLFAFDELNIEITSGSELFIINEIFFERCYNFRLPGEEKIIILDIGMNVGLASLYFASNLQVEMIYAFEPFLPTFKLAAFNFELNPKLAQKINVFNFGLGDKNETLSVAFDPTNSGINATLIESKKVKSRLRESLEIKEAKGIINETIGANSEKKFVLKIDTEGAEYAIFESLFNGGLSKSIIGFIVEWHFKGSGILESRLLEEGFKINSMRINEYSGLIYAFR